MDSVKTMTSTRDGQYSLPVCVLIAVTPLVLALLVVFFAEPRGVVFFEVRPLGWLIDYVIIWPVIWISSDMLQAGTWIWFSPERGVDLRSTLRLTGGFLMVYLCIWLCVVPVVHQLSVKYPFLPIDPASYSQVFRFLFGIAGAVSLLILRTALRHRRPHAD